MGTETGDSQGDGGGEGSWAAGAGKDTTNGKPAAINEGRQREKKRVIGKLVDKVKKDR
jgi:hypothetical protein